MAIPDIRIDIASEFKDRGFKKADKAATMLDRRFKALARTFVTVFSATQIIRFTNQSVRAFAQEDRAIKSLQNTLNNLGLAFQGANSEEFISRMQLATAVSDAELRPAFQALANATLSVEKAQSLLGLSLDISAATGKDLQTVVNGLTKAYLKDTSSLARLNLGLTEAELKTMSFAEAQAVLTERFSGQAAAAADSYEGKVRALTIAFDEAQEVIGKKAIRALELLGEGDFDKTLEKIANAADKVGNAFIRISYGIQKVKALLKGDFGAIAKLQESMNMELAGFGARLGAPGALQKMRQQLTLQTKLEKERAKASKESLKREKEQQALKRAGTVFDLENIQIVAALQGRITEEQRLRLTALLALNNGNAEAAEKLTKAVLALNAASFETLGVTITSADNVDTLISKIINVQAKLFLVNSGIATIPKAKNPFEDWPDIIAKILAQLDAVTSKINNIGKVTAGTAVATASASVSAGTAAMRATTPPGFMKPDYGRVGTTLVNRNLMPDPADMPDKPITPIEPIPQWITDLFGTNPDISVTDIPPQVTINVQGSVVTERDLTNTILNNLYDYQKSGRRVTYETATI